VILSNDGRRRADVASIFGLAMTPVPGVEICDATMELKSFHADRIRRIVNNEKTFIFVMENSNE
jgi:hypothetical protein